MKIKRNQLLMIILAAGFLIGIFYANFAVSKGNIKIDIFDEVTLEYFQAIEIDYRNYLIYIVKERLVCLLIICFLSFIKWKRVYAGLLTGIIGLLSGVLLVVAVVNLGLKGILICLCGVFPQVVFYGMAYGILVWYWFCYPNNKWNRAKTIVVVLTLLLGILVEVYVNPWLIKGIIGIIL